MNFNEINKKIIEQLKNEEYSLSECDIFHDKKVVPFMLLEERFDEVSKRCKSAYETDDITSKIIAEQMSLVYEIIHLEEEHRDELTELAVKMIKDEFKIPEGAVDINASFNGEITDEGIISKENINEYDDFEFDDYEQLTDTNDEVSKRRVLNSMIQGAAKKVNHMFHMVGDEIMDINPRLLNLYKKCMSIADYMYFLIPDMDKMIRGGKNSCDLTSSSKPIINSEAVIFPVLVHELCKGVMELLASHGIPQKENIAEYVINKADCIEDEPWDMRLGPSIWKRYSNAIPDEDFDLRYNLFAEMSMLPPKEFNSLMKEIISGTKKSKEMLSEMLYEIKEEIKEREFNESMGDAYFNEEDLY
jgi:hypothetical protein